MTTFHYRPDGRDDRRPRCLLETGTRPRRSRPGYSLLIEELECRRCPSSAAGPRRGGHRPPRRPQRQPRESAQTAVGAIDLYQVSVDTDGLFVAQVQAAGFDTRLSLLDGQGQLLIQSEASSPQRPRRPRRHAPDRRRLLPDGAGPDRQRLVYVGDQFRRRDRAGAAARRQQRLRTPSPSRT